MASDRARFEFPATSRTAPLLLAISLSSRTAAVRRRGDNKPAKGRQYHANRLSPKDLAFGLTEQAPGRCRATRHRYPRPRVGRVGRAAAPDRPEAPPGR